MSKVIFETKRLIIRRAENSEKDIEFFFNIWTNPKVMINVGFPNGLMITRDDIGKNIAKEDDTEYDKKLVVILKSTGELIGECKLGLPDEEGISETDVKLLPEFWGNKYGIEIKRGLLDYLFTHTECRAVKATPNVKNPASQKMQEAVGGKRVGEEVFHFPEKMRDYTVDVHCYVYMVYREDWEKSR